MALPKRWISTASMALLCLAAAIRAENGTTPSTATLTSAQVVSEMERRNQSRTEELKHYNAVRHYQVDYKGFGADLGAKMEVEVNFDAPGEKNFRIVSQSGSKLLIDKVLKRLLETEKEAAGNQSSSALTTANYSFHMAGIETVGGRPAYILTVAPLTDNKLLYRGRIWVDASDFALVKIEAEPAKNPSFWIARTQISHTYAKTGGFWLPEQNRSESKVRIGGNAVLTIDYGAYQIQTGAVAVAGN
jgi:outer membrane lipoprotein-sorting protein